MRKFALITVICITIVISGSAFSELPLDHLVAYWSFDKGKGGSAKDIVNGIKAQIKDANWVTGKYGMALEFVGQASFALVPEDVEELKNFPDGFTLEAWIMIKGPIDEYSAVVVRKHPEYTLEVRNDMLARATVNGMWGGEWLVGKTKLQPETWYHLALTCDADARRLYISGKKENEKAGVVLKPSSQPLGIGKNVSQDVYFFPGIIDEVKIWNIALTTDQLQESMKGGEPGPGAVEPTDKLSTIWAEIKQ